MYFFFYKDKEITTGVCLSYTGPGLVPQHTQTEKPDASKTQS